MSPVKEEAVGQDHLLYTSLQSPSGEKKKRGHNAVYQTSCHSLGGEMFSYIIETLF